MHIGFQFDSLARRSGQRLALVENGRRWTYGEFVSRLNKVGHALAGLGLGKGDRVGLLLPDCREYLEADYGAMSAGFVRVPLDPRLQGAELASQLADAEVRVLVTHPDYAEKVEALGSARPDHVIAVGGAIPGAAAYEALLERASDRPFLTGAPEDLASINYSGGTTGRPKGIMLTHRALLHAAQGTIMGFGITPENVFLNVRPLWPIAQIVAISHILAGSTVVLGGRFDPDGFPALVAASGADRSSLVPTLLVRLLERHPEGHPDLAGLEAIYIGGSRIPPEVFREALAVLGPRIGVLYGLTEAPVCCYLRPGELADPVRAERLVGAAGQPLFGYDLATRAPDGTVLGPGETGELTLCGDNVMSGYWKRSEDTAAALRDGWLYTGDLGHLDEDGYLFVVGRLKEIIRTGSSSVVPGEVEEVLAAHPAVAEAAVVGLPDREWGEIVAAFVALRSDADATGSDLEAFCRERLPGYKRPRRIVFVDALPRSHYGKVLKAQLLELAR